MDYEIRPTSRNELRAFAKFFRNICGYNQREAIEPVRLLDKLPDLEGFSDVHYDVVSDDALPDNVPARCTPHKYGYLIEIKETVYVGAVEKKIGGYRMHIMHEIMHPYLDKLGFKPIFARTLSGKIPPYRSLEWAVKAIAGEVMMPYEATEHMSSNEIESVYGVSEEAARKRKKY